MSSSGSTGGGTVDAGGTGPTITGGVVKGPALGARVCAFALSAGAKGAPLPVALGTGATGTIESGCYVTAADGTYSFTLPVGTSGDVLLEASGGRFCTDESPIVNGACAQGGAVFSLTDTVMTGALAVPASGGASLYVTPLTTAAVTSVGPQLSATAFANRFAQLSTQVVGNATSPATHPSSTSQPYLAQVAAFMQQGGTLHSAVSTLAKGSTSFSAPPTSPEETPLPTNPSGPVLPPVVAPVQEAHGSDATMFRGGASHTGYVPVSISAAAISQAWQWQASLPEKPDYSFNWPQLRPVAIADGRLFVTTGTYYYKHHQIFAVDLATGLQLWSRELGYVEMLEPPTVAGGKVMFVERTGNVLSSGSLSYLHFLSTQDGSVLEKSGFATQGKFAAPTERSGVVYSGCDVYGGLCAWSLQTMQPMWGHDGMAQTDYWTPAVDDKQVYAYAVPTCAPIYGCLPSGLYTYVKETGQMIGYVAEQIAFPRNALRGDFFTAPIIGSHGNVLVYGAENTTSARSAIASVDVVRETVEWKLIGNYQGQPALAKGVVYALNQDPMRIEAIDESTGAVLWTAAVAGTDEGAYVGNVVATDTSLVFSTNKQVYVFDLATRAVVWTYPSAAEIAVTPAGYLVLSLATKVPTSQWLGAEKTKPALTTGTVIAFRFGAP